MEPSTLVEPLIQDTEGVFCPKVLDSYTGRFEYENVVTGDMLTFGRDGRWCVGSDCSAPMGGATPVSAMMATHQVRFSSWVHGMEFCKLELWSTVQNYGIKKMYIQQLIYSIHAFLAHFRW